jgi:hypothetical protein
LILYLGLTISQFDTKAGQGRQSPSWLQHPPPGSHPTPRKGFPFLQGDAQAPDLDIVSTPHAASPRRPIVSRPLPEKPPTAGHAPYTRAARAKTRFSIEMKKPRHSPISPTNRPTPYVLLCKKNTLGFFWAVLAYAPAASGPFIACRGWAGGFSRSDHALMHDGCEKRATGVPQLWSIHMQ